MDVFGAGAADRNAFVAEVRPAQALDASVAKEVHRRMRRDNFGELARDASNNVILEAHDYNVKDKRTARKSLATSVVREGLQRWLESADGARWRTARDALLTDPDAQDAHDGLEFDV